MRDDGPTERKPHIERERCCRESWGSPPGPLSRRSRSSERGRWVQSQPPRRGSATLTLLCETFRVSRHQARFAKVAGRERPVAEGPSLPLVNKEESL
jgi:hypothetical protein